jgi:hypothetical protein
LSGEAARDGGGGGGDGGEGKRAGDEAGVGPLASLQAAAGLLESPQRPRLVNAAGIAESRGASAGAASVTASLTGVTIEEKERGFQSGSKDDDSEDTRSEVGGDAEVRVSVDEGAKA